jgi:hypothetical protein
MIFNVPVVENIFRLIKIFCEEVNLFHGFWLIKRERATLLQGSGSFFCLFNRIFGLSLVLAL